MGKRKIGKNTLSGGKIIRKRYVKLGKDKLYLEDSQSVWRKNSLPIGTAVWGEVANEYRSWWNKFIEHHGDKLTPKIYLANASDNWAINTILKEFSENDPHSLDKLDPEMSKEELHSLANGISKMLI